MQAGWGPASNGVGVRTSHRTCLNLSPATAFLRPPTQIPLMSPHSTPHSHLPGLPQNPHATCRLFPAGFPRQAQVACTQAPVVQRAIHQAVIPSANSFPTLHDLHALEAPASASTNSHCMSTLPVTEHLLPCLHSRGLSIHPETPDYSCLAKLANFSVV